MQKKDREWVREREKAYEGRGKFYDRKDKTRNAVDNSTDGEH